MAAPAAPPTAPPSTALPSTSPAITGEEIEEITKNAKIPNLFIMLLSLSLKF
jgi:hypothetical protein